MRFEVWAPNADRVDVEVEGRSTALDRAELGWWAADADAAPGDRYAYRLDGGDSRADPRSRRQPDGVEGPSCVVDLDAHPWSDRGFRAPPHASWILYELHVGTFTAAGTFDAAAERLDHLVELGVTTVEVMPVAAFPGRHGWGYDGVHLWATHEPYGGPAAFQRFVDAAHGAGLAVVLDVVHNHLGPLGNHLRDFGPYFTDAVTTPWGDAINLEGPGSDEVRAFLIGSACAWLRDFHLDGLRLDAVHALHDRSARPFLAELSAEVRALEAAVERPLVLIAESDQNDPRLVEPPEAGGHGLHAVWADELHHVIHVALSGERLGYYEDYRGRPSELADALRHGFVHRGQRSSNRGRRHGRPLHPDTALDRMVVASQNHDQVGNRALGERLEHLTGVAQARVAAALVVLAPGLPMLFQGEEWAASSPFQYFTDHPDPELAAAVRDGRRSEFAAFDWDPDQIPDPQDEETWRRSCLRWDETVGPRHAAMLDWYRTLVALRRARPELRDARQEAVRVSWDDDAGWLVLDRSGLMLACSLNTRVDALTVPCPGRSVLLATEGARFDPARQEARLAPWSVLVTAP